MSQTIIEEEDEEDEDIMSNKKSQLLPDEDLSLFTKKKVKLPDSDDEDFGFERPKFTRRGSATMPEVNEETFDMEKYRPHNYEIGRPKGDDINDLMDYYSKFKMTRNAIGRTNVGARTSFNGNHHDDYYDDEEEFSLPARQKKFSDPEQLYTPEDDIPPAPPRKKYSDPEDYNLPPQPRGGPRSALDYGDSIDPATKLILMRNSDPVPQRVQRNFDDDMSPEPRRNFSNQQRFGGGMEDDMSYLRPSPPPERPSGSGDTAMSSHTRMMLDKLKQSTAQLQDLTEGGEETFVPAKRGGRQQQKKSRFMRNMNTEEDFQAEDSEKYYSSLANNVLGLRNDSMGDYDKYRPDPMRISPPKRPTRKNYDFDDEPAAPQSRKFVDEDDTDAMIANLKQKTTRRAATDILRDIEADTDQDTIKFEPVKSFKDSFRPEPEMKYGSLNRMTSARQTQPKKSYLEQDDTPNPFSSLRSKGKEPPSDGMYGNRYGGRKAAGYGGLEDDDGGYSTGGAGGYGAPQQNYGSLGRNYGGTQQYQQQQPGQFMQQQPQMGNLYGPDGGYGQDMYGLQGGYMGGQMGGQFQQQMYGQPQPQQWGGMAAGQGYDQMGYGGGMGGYGGGMQQQHPGANLRQARHQRYGGQNSGGW